MGAMHLVTQLRSHVLAFNSTVCVSLISRYLLCVHCVQGSPADETLDIHLVE